MLFFCEDSKNSRKNDWIKGKSDKQLRIYLSIAGRKYIRRSQIQEFIEF